MQCVIVFFYSFCFRWYPGCAYVQQNKGVEFVKKSRSQMKPEEIATAENLDYNKTDVGFLGKRVLFRGPKKKVCHTRFSKKNIDTFSFVSEKIVCFFQFFFQIRQRPKIVKRPPLKDQQGLKRVTHWDTTKNILDRPIKLTRVRDRQNIATKLVTFFLVYLFFLFFLYFSVHILDEEYEDQAVLVTIVQELDESDTSSTLGQ